LTDFNSISGFIKHIGAMALVQHEAEQAVLKDVVDHLKHVAMEKFGHYQPGAGEIAEWQELAESTKEDRVAQGFTENDPLLRSGTLRDTTDTRVGDGVGYMGSDDPIMLYQEVGTAHIPPRSVYGLTGAQEAEHVANMVGRALASALVKAKPKIT
jgi:hypothetical protein